MHMYALYICMVYTYMLYGIGVYLVCICNNYYYILAIYSLTTVIIDGNFNRLIVCVENWRYSK